MTITRLLLPNCCAVSIPYELTEKKLAIYWILQKFCYLLTTSLYFCTNKDFHRYKRTVRSRNSDEKQGNQSRFWIT